MPAFPPPPRPPSNYPVDVGQRSEAAILAAFIERGFEVLMPWGTNHRCDVVLDLGDRFLRVQCKTGRLRNGAPTSNGQSRHVRWAADHDIERFEP
jgi:hypothetical protein